MIMADNKDNKNPGKGMDIFCECMAGMLYSDEEIRETMSAEDAEEFIRLRNELVAPDKDVVIGTYDVDDIDRLMAAEDSETYE